MENSKNASLRCLYNMHEYGSDFKEYLRIGKLADSLTVEEEAIFEDLLQKDAAFQNAFLELSAKFTPAYLSNLSKYKKEDYWQPARTLAPEKKPFLAAGIGIALAIVTAGLFIFLNYTDRRPIAASIKEEPAIQLTLANGKTINLLANKGKIKTEMAVISNSGKTLSYVSADSGQGGSNTLTVSPGMDYQITLGDGSKLWLNSKTTLTFPFTFEGDRREISIDGEAYLEIAKQAKKPFIVHLPGSTVEVLGTSFNVNSYSKGVEKISLLDGSVKITADQGGHLLKPGLQAVSSGQKMELIPFDARKTLSWKDGVYYFEEATLEEIIAVINRWFNVTAVIDNTRNNNKRFVGVVNKRKPLQDFLKTLEYVADFDSYFDKNGTLHFK